MKQDQLYDAITDLRDDQIEQGGKPLARAGRPKRPLWLGGIAAVLALAVLSGAVVLPRLRKAPKPGAAPEQTIGPTDTQNQTESQTQPPKPTSASAPTPTGDSMTASGEIEAAEGTIRLYQLSAPTYPKTPAQSADPAAWQSRYDALRLTDAQTAALQPFLAGTVPAVLGESAGENRLYAPVNVYLALSMLTEVTDGATRQELLRLLSAPDPETLRTEGKALWEASYSDDPELLTSIPAASIWLSDAVRYNAGTLQTLASDYYASAYSGRMGSESYDQAIRTWINAHTGNLLDQQVGAFGTGGDTLAVLLSTIYYKASWEEGFYESNTRPGAFSGPNGEEQTDFLHGGEKTDAWTENGFTAIGKSLQGGGTMYFLLPDKGMSPEELLRQPDALAFLGSDAGRDALAHRLCLVDFSVPKFDVDAALDLTDTLSRLGVRSVFRSDLADFSPLLAEDTPCYLQGFLHAARVRIDEKGCEAAAFTSAAPGEAPPQEEPERLTLRLNRPFVFAITSPDGLPLFIGVVNHPEAG